MAETKRYRLRADIPGEMFGEDHGGMIWLRYQMPDGEHTLAMAADLLEEIPPPIPDEPEPGAYLIGELVCERRAYVTDAKCWLNVVDDDWMTWAQLWDRIGGPDVRIVALVPKYDPSEPLAQWEQHLLDKQAEVVEAEREVIEAAKAWHTRVRQQKPGHESARHFTEGNLLRALDWLTSRETDHA